MIEDLDLIRDYDILNRRKNLICGSKDYVRKAGKLLVRACIGIEKIYCDDEITDGELAHIEKAPHADIFNVNEVEKYNVIYAEHSQEILDKNVTQLDRSSRVHIYTYCGLYFTMSAHADRYNLTDMVCMNDLNMAVGTYDLAARWLRSIRWVEESGIELILYAMPKTGTQSMKATLNKYGFEHTYVHFLNLSSSLKKQFYYYYGRKISCLEEMLCEPEFVKKNHLNGIKEKKIKVITSVREPIARNYSMIFQAIKNWGLYPLVHGSNTAFEQGVLDYLSVLSDSTWEWFDDEIKEVFGIDVFQYPFDKEKGYCTIKKGNVEIFLYRLESCRYLGSALGEFLGVPEKIDMLMHHQTNEEEYRFIYNQLKQELHIPSDILSKSYDNCRMRHFYTEDEITNFINKWK